MGKAIYVVIVAAVAIMAIPAAAQATHLQAGATELGNGSKVLWESPNLSAKILGGEGGTIKCSSGKLENEVTSSQGENVALGVIGNSFTGCTALGLSAHVTTNAGEKPWTLQVQEPKAGGVVTVHLKPASGSSIQFKAQVQFFGSSILTCDYSASGLELKGEEGSDLLRVEGSAQFVKQSGASGCGEGATLEGEGELESGGEWVTAVREVAIKLCSEAKKVCPNEKIYGKNTGLEATLKENPTVFTGVSCAESTLKGENTADSGNPLPGVLTTMSFASCKSVKDMKITCTVKALGLNYQLVFYATETVGDGSMFIVVKEFEIDCPGEKKACKYERFGLPKMRLEGGEPATLYAENETFPLVKGGNVGECGAATIWNGTYTVTVPDTLYVSLE